jgi:hypothetical protein
LKRADADDPTLIEPLAGGDSNASGAGLSRFLARVLPGAKPAPFHDFIEPCLASLRTNVSSAVPKVPLPRGPHLSLQKDAPIPRAVQTVGQTVVPLRTVNERLRLGPAA